MKRCSIIVIGLILLSFATSCFGVYPNPDGTITLQMRQGWYNGQPVWYICTDTNDIKFAYDNGLTLAPKLSSAFYGAGAAAVFFVLNPAATQGPVFETMPGQSLYSGIWRIRFVTWNAGAPKVPLTSINQILTLQGMGQLTWVDSNIRVDCPIMAVGPLGGPWTPAPAGSYRIAQGMVAGNYTYTKLITLPYYNVFCQDPITRAVGIRKVIITDSCDKTLAKSLGANKAPALCSFPFSDTMRFWYLLDSPMLCQLPVIQACPTSLSWMNRNYDYSPVMQYTVLIRNIPPYAVVNNPPYIQQLLGTGGLVVSSQNTRINAPVVP